MSLVGDRLNDANGFQFIDLFTVACNLSCLLAKPLFSTCWFSIAQYVLSFGYLAGLNNSKRTALKHNTIVVELVGNQWTLELWLYCIEGVMHGEWGSAIHVQDCSISLFNICYTLVCNTWVTGLFTNNHCNDPLPSSFSISPSISSLKEQLNSSPSYWGLPSPLSIWVKVPPPPLFQYQICLGAYCLVNCSCIEA